MRTVRIVRKVVVAAATAALSFSCSDSFRLDEESLAAEGSAVAAAFADVGLALPAGLSFALVGPADMEAVLAREAVARAKGAFGADETLEARARAEARRLSIQIFVKHDARANRVLVAAENLARAGVDRDRDRLRGMLLHECGQAYGERRFGIGARLDAARSPEELVKLTVYGAGQALFFARRAARQAGWEGALELATTELGDASGAAAGAAHAALFEAESTVASRFESGGEDAVARLFAADAVPRHDFDAMLVTFRGHCPEWQARMVSMSEAMIRQSLTFLGADEVDRIVGGTEFDRSIRLTEPGENGRVVSASFRQHADAEEAAYLVGVLRKVFEAQPGATVEVRAGAGWSGFFALPTAAEDGRVESALVNTGDVSISAVFAGGISPGELTTLLDQLTK